MGRGAHLAQACALLPCGHGPGVSFIKLNEGFLLKCMCAQKPKMVYVKNIQTDKTVSTRTCKQSLLYKSHITYTCAHVSQPLIPPCTQPFLTINSQYKAPHECVMRINVTLSIV